MSSSAQPKPQDDPKDGSLAVSVPEEVQQVIEKLPASEAKGLLSIFLARSTTTFGPDPETAKTIAQAEMHEEECRLKGYQSSLANKESQSQRDHEYRKKKLNHRTGMSAVVLTVSVAGVVAGLALAVTGNTALGNPVLIAAFTMLSGMSGKLLRSADDD